VHHSDIIIIYFSPRQCPGCTRIDGTLMQREIEILILKAYDFVLCCFQYNSTNEFEAHKVIEL